MPFNEQERIDYVYPFTGNDPDMDLMLFFTDNRNEPKAINIRRCIHEDEEFTGNAPGYIDQELEDFTQACPRVPMVPIEFDYENDLNDNGVAIDSNFKETDGMVFAYQNVYRNGYVSAPSLYSKVAYPPTIATIGADPIVSALIENRISLYIPRQNAEVYRIRILFKEGDAGIFKLIDEVSTSVDQQNDDFTLLYSSEDATEEQEELGLVNDEYAGVYRFKNDRIYPVIPKDEADKHFDKVPQVAQAQGLSGHRIMYGNYIEGFDNIQAQASSSVVYKPRPEDFVSFNLDVKPTFVDNGTGNAASSAFIIDTAGMSEEITPNFYEVTINIRPQRNIHVYRVGSTNYRGSQQSSDDDGNLNFEANLTDIVDDFGAVLYGPQSIVDAPDDDAGTVNTVRMFSGNEGVATFGWKQPNSSADTTHTGTTPASPLILKVNNIPITFSFSTVDSGVTLTPSDLSNVIDIILTGSSNGVQTNPSYNALQYLDSLGVELLDAPGFGPQFSRSSVSVGINLGLANGSKFLQNSFLSELICTMGQGGLANSVDSLKPAGFFIINKATSKFGFEKHTPLNGTTRRAYRLRLDNLIIPETLDAAGNQTGVQDPEAILTCFPLPQFGHGTIGYYPDPTYQANTSIGGTGDASDQTQGNPLFFGPPNTIAPIKPNRWKLDAESIISQTGAGSGPKEVRWPTISNAMIGSNGGESAPFTTGIPLNQNGSIPGTDTNGQSTNSQSGLVGVDPESFYAEPQQNDYCPAPIGEWLALSSEGVINQQFWPEYTYEGENLYGTSLISAAGFFNWGDSDTSTWTAQNSPDGTLKNVMKGFGFNSACWEGYVQNFQYNASYLDPESIDYDPIFLSPYALVDGDAGPGGKRDIARPYSDTAIAADGEVENLTRPSWNVGDQKNGDTAVNIAYGADGPDSSNLDYIIEFDVEFQEFDAPTGVAPKHNRYGSIWSTTFLGIVDNMPYINQIGEYTSVTQQEDAASTNPFKKNAFESSPLEFINVVANFGQLGDTSLSFKTRATHDFGIAYYDKRGRRSAINKLASVYVPGYSVSERPEGTPRGPVAVKLRINSAAPSTRDANGDLLIDSYRIFYSNRNESKRFIQYSSGGAYTEKGSSPVKGKIYVSLNYLQANNISYTESYGARDADTDEPIMYRYSPGDKLRVISYYNADGTRIFAEDNVVFTVLGVEKLTPQLEDHPLYDNQQFSLLNQEIQQRNGDFVVLQNNEDALGFNSSDIDNGSTFWDDRCIFEIVSPEKESVDEIQAYFETSYGGRVLDTPDGIAIHEQPPVPEIYAETSADSDFVDTGFVIEEGDVFFRAVPVNFREYDNVLGSYADLIVVNEEGGDVSEPNFVPYYLETESLTDLHRTKAKGYGKVNYIDPDVYRKRKQSSVTFSQKTNPSFFKLKHSSFPHYDDQMYFDLPEKHGEVNYIVGEDEYITSIQQNKAAVIPVDRSITETVQGDTALNISEKVLNSAKFYIGEGGCSGNPESVVPIDGYVYFVDKANKRISRLNPSSQTVENISELGMEQYFNRQLEELMESSMDRLNYSDIRIVGGFDPMENEYIVSFLKPNMINTPSFEGIVQPNDQHPFLLPLAQLELNFSGGRSHESFVNTAAFDHQGGESWKTRYSYNSTNYGKANNRFISFKPLSPVNTNDTFVWDHGRNETRNFFHGVQYQSMIKAVSTAQKSLGPSATKVYNAIGLEGTASWPAVIRTQNEICKVGDYRDYEGTRFSNIKGSRSDASTSNTLAIGRVSNASFDGDAGLLTLTFETQVNRYPLNLGGSVETFRMVNNSVVPVFTTVSQIQPISIVDDFTILYSVGSQELVNPQEVQQLVGRIIIHRSSGNGYGDRPRDKYAIVSLYNNSPQEVELYSINMEVSNSNLDSSA